MFDVIGKCNKATVMIDTVDETTLKQIYELLNSEVVKDSVIVIQPDTHCGKGCVIGYTQKLDKNNPRVCPNLLGVDIGCNITTASLKMENNIDFPKFDKCIRNIIPMGTGGYLSNGLPSIYKDIIKKEDLKLFDDAEKLLKEDSSNSKMKVSILNQLISVGSGNHFIEIGKLEDKTYITIHSGSRNFGLTVCNVYQKHAQEYCGYNTDLSFLDNNSPYFDRYLQCVHACQQFSKLNHFFILKEITSHIKKEYDCKSKIIDYIETMHNYIDLEDMIIRKGAVKSKKGEKLLIPFNMRDGMAICMGKGNIDWNYSAPHGAGRLMSRGEAKRSINLNDVKADMNNNGIYTPHL